jgi:hypothetical protein
MLHLFRQEHYQIKAQGLLKEQPGDWCDGFSIEAEDGITTFSGALDGQIALYDLLAHLKRQHLPLLSVERVEPSLEEVFIHLIEEKKEEPHEKLIVSPAQ